MDYRVADQFIEGIRAGLNSVEREDIEKAFNDAFEAGRVAGRMEAQMEYAQVRKSDYNRIPDAERPMRTRKVRC